MLYSELEKPIPSIICDWCGKPITTANHSKNSVCPRCYSILITAGLSDERIFEKAIYKSGLLAKS